jgi:Arc/MetJ-type ribon-helix-helix transcriptional regulator
MPKKEGPDMVLISLHMPKPVVEALDELVRLGVVPNRSEAIRQAVTEYIAKYMCTFTRLKEAATEAAEVSVDKAFRAVLLKGR